MWPLAALIPHTCTTLAALALGHLISAVLLPVATLYCYPFSPRQAFPHHPILLALSNA